MIANTPPGIVIRDGMEADLPRCLELDHSYSTDTVWQMQMYHEEHLDEYQISLRRERLPRTIEVSRSGDETHLRLALPADQCFLVAVNRDTDQIVGYLTMMHNAIHHIGDVQEIVIDRPHRRSEVGTRLVNVARRWAKEHQIIRMTVHTQTKNYPAMAFLQQLGFTFCGFNDRFFPNQDIAVFFTQSLR
ncbi:MAG: GNAT family N-acetyltransferase [Anaerolineae bacterium]